jgi:tetratricopeptide (TPR) repeat protein
LWARGRIDSIEDLSRAVLRAARNARQEEGTRTWLMAVMSGQGRAREYVMLSTERALARARAANPGADSSTIAARAALDIALDRATSAMVFSGDEGRAKAILKQAMSKSVVDGTSPADRNWIDLAMIAAVIGDAKSARAIEEGYARDRVPYRAIWGTRVKASAAIAAGRWNDGLDGLTRIGKLQPTPYVEDLLLGGLAHERAGRPDSAIVWYERAVSRNDAERLGVSTWYPIMHRRLGEMYDKQGNAAKAIEHYEWFANAWKKADPELQPTVRAARERAAALRAKLTPG